MICRICNVNTTGRSDVLVCRTCDPRPRCRHCQCRVANRARGLCYPCYSDTAIRDLYQPNEIAQRYANGGKARPDVNGRRPLPRTPTAYAPGTLEKIDVMADRASRREAIHHPLDADHSGAGRRIEMKPRRTDVLSREDKLAIAAARAEGVQARVLAERYGVLPQTVYDVASRYGNRIEDAIGRAVDRIVSDAWETVLFDAEAAS